MWGRLEPLVLGFSKELSLTDLHVSGKITQNRTRAGTTSHRTEPQPIGKAKNLTDTT